MGRNKAVKVVEMYYLGVLNNDVIFWQIDTLKSLRAGKVMAYNEVGKHQGILGGGKGLKAVRVS